MAAAVLSRRMVDLRISCWTPPAAIGPINHRTFCDRRLGFRQTADVDFRWRTRNRHSASHRGRDPDQSKYKYKFVWRHPGLRWAKQASAVRPPSPIEAVRFRTEMSCWRPEGWRRQLSESRSRWSF